MGIMLARLLWQLFYSENNNESNMASREAFGTVIDSGSNKVVHYSKMKLESIKV